MDLHFIESDLVAKERMCLKCKKLFMSHWVGNRLCLSCSNLVTTMSKGMLPGYEQFYTNTNLGKKLTNEKGN